MDRSDTRAYPSHGTAQIRGVIPLELALPTTGRTSGCLIVVNVASNREPSVSILPCSVP